jgi:hypothetical protein
VTTILMNDSHSEIPTHSHVWHCEACHCVHIRAGEVLMTLTRSEFLAFADSINDCYWQQKLFGLSDKITHSSETPVETEVLN